MKNSISKINIHNIGENWSDAIDLGSNFKEIFQMYDSQTCLISSIINKHRIDADLKALNLIDLGGADGKLVNALQKEKDWWRGTKVTCVDLSLENLSRNSTADFRILGDLVALPFEGIYDIALLRYVLQYNSFNSQKQIIKSISDSLVPGGICINWFCGSRNFAHQEALNKFFRECNIEPLKRPNCHWTTLDEVKSLYEDCLFEVSISSEYTVVIRDLFRIRYGLSEELNSQIIQSLGEHAYLEYAVFTAVKPETSP